MQRRGWRTSGPWLVITGCLAAVAVLGACGGGTADQDSPAVAMGEKVFQDTCATCHGPDAHGLPKLGKDLHDNAWIQDHTDAELIAFLKVGRPAWDPLNTRGVDMPPKGGNPTLTDEDLANVIAFLRTLQ